jgi:hypothetical protein
VAAFAFSVVTFFPFVFLALRAQRCGGDINMFCAPIDDGIGVRSDTDNALLL